MSIPPVAPSPRQERDILLELRLFGVGRRSQKQIVTPTQRVPFRVVLRVTNRGSKIVPALRFSHPELQAGDFAVRFRLTFKEEYSCTELSPGESKDVTLDDHSETTLEGPCWFLVAVHSADPHIDVKTFRRVGPIVEPFPGINQFGCSVFVERHFEATQAKTNRILLWIAVLTFAEGVFGLRAIALASVRVVQSVLRFLGTIGA